MALVSKKYQVAKKRYEVSFDRFVYPSEYLSMFRWLEKKYGNIFHVINNSKIVLTSIEDATLFKITFGCNITEVD